MDKLEEFKNYIRRYKAQKESSLDMSILIMRKILREIVEFTHENIEQYVLSLIDKDYQASTIRSHISLIHFWGECFGIEIAERYKFKGRLKQKPYDRDIFNDEETRAFLTLPNPFKKGCLYWKRYEMWNVFWTICAHQACRPGEAIRLRTFPIKGNESHVDFGLNTITFDQKTGKRSMAMAKTVREKLLIYLPKVVGEYLFPPLHKSKLPYMSCESWENDFTNRRKRLEEKYPDIKNRKNLDPYSVRTTGATRWGRQKMQMNMIKELMGHKKITTTEKYIKFDLNDQQIAIDSDSLSLPYLSPDDALSYVEEQIAYIKRTFSEQLESIITSSQDQLVVVYRKKK